MKFYNLSESRLRRLLRNPKRKEAGIVPGTIALMQPAGSKKHPTEIWLMYQIVKLKDKSQKFKIITAWRYPGVSPIREPLPIPEDISQEIEKLWSVKKKKI